MRLGRHGLGATILFAAWALPACWNVDEPDEGADRPDLQIVFQPARRNPNGFPLPLGHGYAISAVNLYPRSRGRLRLASSDPRALPRIDLNLLGDPEDLKPILSGLKLGRRLLDRVPEVGRRSRAVGDVDEPGLEASRFDRVDRQESGGHQDISQRVDAVGGCRGRGGW